jgi:two-component system chemotaxis response regulator CheY
VTETRLYQGALSQAGEASIREGARAVAMVRRDGTRPGRPRRAAPTICMTRQRYNDTRPRSLRGTRAKKLQTILAPVLVVDDEPIVRQALAEIVISAGFPVVEASDGDVAIDLLRAGLSPALILIDLAMQRMDARAFRIEQLKDPALRKIATVVLTGSIVDPEALGRELGGVRVMAKPVDCDEIVAILRRHCSRAA